MRGATLNTSPRDAIQRERSQAGMRRKGQPPPLAAPTMLSAEARAMLARCNSDMPPSAIGFGGKISADGGTILTMFPGKKVPKRLELTEEELKNREIAAIVNQGEEASLACLGGLLKGCESAFAKTEDAMAAEAAKAKALQAEMEDRGPDSHRPGVRAGRRRRKKKKRPSYDGYGAAEEDADDDEEDGSDLDEESDDDGDDDADEKGSRRRKDLPMPITQGSDESVFAALQRARLKEAEALRRLEEAEELEEGFIGGSAAGTSIAGFDEYGRPELGPTADRLRRTMLVDDVVEVSDADNAASSSSWPQVSTSEVVQLMRRSRFIKDAEVQEELMPLVADWFEVQCYEGGRVLAEEGTWCHSFVMLYEGTLEARGRVYRTNNPKGGLLSLINKGKDNLGNDIKKLEEEKAAAEAAKVARLGDDDEEEELPPLLPQPQLVGAYETLAPILLHPGAYFGEAALAGAESVHAPKTPHTCTIRTLERCTVLALRRATVNFELPKLPVMARLAWEQESLRQQKTFALVHARWRHHNLRRLRLFKSLDSKLLHNLERFVEFRLLPQHACIYRGGERVTHLFIILDGNIGEFVPRPNTSPFEPMASTKDLLARADTFKSPSKVIDAASQKKQADSGHDVTSCRRGGRDAPWSAGGVVANEIEKADAVGVVDEDAANSLHMRRTVSDMSDVPLVGEGPLLLADPKSDPKACASKPPSEAICLTLSQCQVLAVPYAELSKRPNLAAEIRTRVKDAKQQPSTLLGLLQPPPRALNEKGEKSKVTLGGVKRAGKGIALALAQGKLGDAMKAGAGGGAALFLATKLAKSQQEAPAPSAPVPAPAPATEPREAQKRVSTPRVSLS